MHLQYGDRETSDHVSLGDIDSISWLMAFFHYGPFIVFKNMMVHSNDFIEFMYSLYFRVLVLIFN